MAVRAFLTHLVRGPGCTRAAGEVCTGCTRGCTGVYIRVYMPSGYMDGYCTGTGLRRKLEKSKGNQRGIWENSRKQQKTAEKSEIQQKTAENSRNTAELVTLLL